MLSGDDPDPIIIIPVVENCAKNCGNLPGLDWLWWTLGTLGAIGFLGLSMILAIWWFERY